MVHGGGACSSGGGSFGGGGFSSGVYLSTNSYTHFGSRSRHNDEANKECVKCVAATCVCIGVCVCCRGQGYVNTMLIFWTWLVVLTLITGLSVGLGRFGPTDILVSPSDMVPMTRGIDPVFCEGVNIQTTLPVTTYVLPSEPAISSERKNYSFNKTALIGEDRYEYWGFYLIAGSDIEIITCTRYYLNLYIIKGEKQFGYWKNDNTNPDHSQEKHTMGGCTYPMYYTMKVSFHVSDTDEYYFAFANDAFTATISVDIVFNLDRAVYDLGGDENIVCSNSTLCKVDFATGSKNAIVVYVPQSDEFDFVVKTHCLSRISVFLAIFLLIPVSMGCLYTVVMWYRKRRASKKISTSTVQLREEQTSPENQTIQRKEEPVRKPPSYGSHDDGIAVKPPTYEEAVSRSGQVKTT